MKPELALFDLDGVIIRSFGYRRATTDTLLYFTRQMGQDDLTPVESDYALFESVGITNEWDIVALSLAMVLETASQVTGRGLPADTLAGAAQVMLSAELPRLNVDFAAFIPRLPGYFRPGVCPSLAVLRACKAGDPMGVFPLLKNSALLADLLGNNQDIANCPATRYFQGLISGSQELEQIFHLQPEVETDSYLLLYDRVLIGEETAARLVESVNQKAVFASIMTARPSFPPREVGNNLAGYSPEAEKALEKAGLTALHLMGLGRLQYLAKQSCDDPNRFLKPAPLHALAAMAAAWSGNEQAALEWAYDLLRGSGNRRDGMLPASFRVHVFEDSPVGVLSCQQAVEVLQHCGYSVETCYWGVATNPHKAAALKQLGADVLADVNQALEKSGLTGTLQTNSGMER